jgi:hypothetical protein
MLELDNPETYTGHCMRRTAATRLANSGASGQQLRHKLNHRSEKACNEYLHSSKAVQHTNAMMLSGYEENKEDENDPLKETSENFIASPCSSAFEKSVKAAKKDSNTFESNPMNDINEALRIFHSGENNFTECKFEFHISK